ncbi:MAG: hypothetical protein AB7N65_30640 [Vicinamibacterales bacterium]
MRTRQLLGRSFSRFLVVLTLLAALGTPVVSGERARENAMGDSCPMMAHLASDEPCIGAPCPCDHGSDAGMVLSTAAPAILRTVSVALDRTTHRVSLPPPALTFAGFPFHLDRPPTLS